MNDFKYLAGWAAAVITCVAVWAVFYGLVFTRLSFAEHSVSILSGIAAGTVVRAVLQGKFRNSGDHEDED